MLSHRLMKSLGRFWSVYACVVPKKRLLRVHYVYTYLNETRQKGLHAQALSDVTNVMLELAFIAISCEQSYVVEEKKSYSALF